MNNWTSGEQPAVNTTASINHNRSSSGKHSPDGATTADPIAAAA